MNSQAAVIYLTFAIVSSPSMSSSPKNSLNGKHLRVIVMEFPITVLIKRNASGYVVDFDGLLVHHLVTLSTMFNFSYSYLPPVGSQAEAPFGKDGVNYILNNEADYYLTANIATPPRLKQIDYPTSFYNGPFSCIVLYPKEKLNFKASLKPFAYDVWIIILCAVLAIGLYFYSVKKLPLRVPSLSRNPTSVKSEYDNGSKQITDFVLGNLVSQGQSFFSSRLVFRIAAGAWCAGCFFLVQVYCSTLTSHLTASNQKPIANSVRELVNTPGISLTADNGYALEILLKGAERGDFKRLADMFKKNPKLLCNSTSDCLETVKDGNAAYGAPVNNLKVIMENDLKRFGTCNYYMMKENFLSSNVFTILPKNSQHMETISIGILRFQQFGFYKKWISWYLPDPRQCMELKRSKNITKLSLGHLSSAFVILLAGYLVSFSTFVFETIMKFVLGKRSISRITSPFNSQKKG